MRPSLLQTLKKLRLSGLAQSLEIRLSEAAGNRLDHAEFLELILQDEINVRCSRLIGRRVKAACFGEVKALDEFDFSFNPSIKRRQIHDLASCQFLREKADVLLLGPPGVGKTFLVRAIGHQAIKAGFVVLYRSIFDLARDFLGDEDLSRQDRTLARYLKPDLLIIDDMGMKQLPRHSGECLLEIIMRRHENRSTMMTSNRPLEDWAKLIGDAPAATAILDRFLQHATIVNITGRSYRLRNGGNSQAKTNANRRSAAAEGSRRAGSGESLSPPEDTNASVAVSSGGGRPAGSEAAVEEQAD
jgi:DNA replication protein DnaC